MSRMIGTFFSLAVLVVAVSVRAEEPKGTDLPLKRVVLFSSGVGFFENSGKVENDAKVIMKFKIDQINDLLKSLVVQDLDGGQVSTVNYGSKDPITKTLKSFAVDLTANPTMAQLLGQVRGEKVELEAPNKISGVILGVETHKKQVGENQFIDVQILNLLTDEGLRAIPMDSIAKLKLSNEQLNDELKKALNLLASSHATDKKSVEISFLGKGERRVQVGYIQETPVWKTTYRLVLSDKKPLLQGWAIIENTSEEDWKDVSLSLVSGRPISFAMDLYQPLYVSRPFEELELFASLRPQVYGQDLAGRGTMPTAKIAGMAGGKVLEQQKELAMQVALADAPGEELAKKAESVLGGVGVRSVAQAAEVGNFFQYAINTPVSLPRQQSAMLPIVSGEVKAEKVSIYNQSVQAKHPLSGMQFTNTTGLFLMQGPITVFDGGSYAGDAKIEDLPPNAQRLISYALDLDTEVAPVSKNRPEELLSVKLLKGIMHTSRKNIRQTEYTVKNSGKAEKKVLIEYPIDPRWKLLNPAKPDEKTRNLYRFAVAAQPNTPVNLSVEEELVIQEQLALTNINDDTIVYYLNSKIVGDKVKAAFQEILKQKKGIQDIAMQKQVLEQRIREIGEDQNRIRQNMQQLDRNSEIYKSYVKKFSEQEAEIEKSRGTIASLNDREVGLKKALDEYLLNLDVQ